MEQHKIDRINALARLAKERSLTAEEAAARDTLRKEYIAEWRRSTEAVLANTYILDENGNEVPLKKKDS